MYGQSIPGHASLIAIAIFAAIACAAAPALASECAIFGKAPFCAGRCPAGWHEEGLASYECATGRKVRCCKDCGPAQYGTPGCPYPSFSPCKPGWTPWTFNGKNGCCPPGTRYFAWGGSAGCAKTVP